MLAAATTLVVTGHTDKITAAWAWLWTSDSWGHTIVAVLLAMAYIF